MIVRAQTVGVDVTSVSRRITCLIIMAIVLVLSSCATTGVEEQVEESVSDRSPVAYLDTTIPPCTPVDGSAEDPCPTSEDSSPRGW